MKIETARKIIVLAHADTEAKCEPSAGEHIDGRRLPSEKRRLARGSDHYAGHQPYAPRRSGSHRQDRKRFERLRDDAIGNDHAGKRTAIRACGPFEHQFAGS
jgi:hypothetical protein